MNKSTLSQYQFVINIFSYGKYNSYVFEMNMIIVVV